MRAWLGETVLGAKDKYVKDFEGLTPETLVVALDCWIPLLLFVTFKLPN